MIHIFSRNENEENKQLKMCGIIRREATSTHMLLCPSWLATAAKRSYFGHAANHGSEKLKASAFWLSAGWLAVRMLNAEMVGYCQLASGQPRPATASFSLLLSLSLGQISMREKLKKYKRLSNERKLKAKKAWNEVILEIFCLLKKRNQWSLWLYQPL